MEATGKKGQILKRDLLTYLKEKEESIEKRGDSGKNILNKSVPLSRDVERVKMSPIRRKIAERLLKAQQTTAMLTTFNEVDMSEIIKIRKEYQEKVIEHHGVKLGFMGFFVKAVTQSLLKYPGVNGLIDDGEIVYHKYCDVGVAVSTERGLVVPIIRDAQNKSIVEIEKSIAHYAAKAKKGEISLEEMAGGTFTITNGGIFGSLLSSPILNPPQSGILGMHQIQQRAVVVDGKICIRPMMYIALSYDHRIIDGKEAVGFLVSVKSLVESPSRLLLEV